MPKSMMRTLAFAVALVATPAAGHTVADWSETSAKLSSQEQKAPGPPDTRVAARVALAMFEAANAVEGRFTSYLRLARGQGPAAVDLAAARAAHDVLAAEYPHRGADLADALALARLRVEDPQLRARSEDIGRSAAIAVLARHGFVPGADPPYVPAATPGRYIGTDLPVLAPRARLAKPYFIDTPQSVAPSPPPAMSTARYAADLAEVQRLGRREGSARTAGQTALGVFWARMDMLSPLRDLTVARGRSLTDNARTYALTLMAIDDASNAVTAAKLDFNAWRPITAIRNADADGNPATVAEAAWEPLLRTPPHPEFPCGHCIVSTTFATVLAAEFGEDVQLHFRDPVVPAASRTLTPREIIQEASLSRILVGAHFRYANDAAQQMGREIGVRAAQAMTPLSEGAASARR